MEFKNVSSPLDNIKRAFEVWSEPNVFSPSFLMGTIFQHKVGNSEIYFELNSSLVKTINIGCLNEVVGFMNEMSKS